jgi:hypothetical protein
MSDDRQMHSEQPCSSSSILGLRETIATEAMKAKKKQKMHFTSC